MIDVRKLISGIIVIAFFSGAGIMWEISKEDTKLYNSGELIAKSKFIVSAERTYINVNTAYRDSIMCPDIIKKGGYRQGDRCYYPKDFYEILKRSLIKTTIDNTGIDSKQYVLKTVPFYAYGTTGSYAGILKEKMTFDENVKDIEDFPEQFSVSWLPKDTRNYQLIWRLENIKSNYKGTYYDCNYTFGNVKIDLKEDCSKLDYAIIDGKKADFYFKKTRGEQFLNLAFYDPPLKTDLAINFVSPTNGNNSILNVNYTAINVTFLVNETNNATAIVDWNGTNMTYTNSSFYQNSSTFYGLLLNKTNLIDGNYTYRVYVNDTNNNTNSTGSRIITINEDYPTITTTIPAVNDFYAQNITMSGTITDVHNISYAFYNMTNASGNVLRTKTITTNDSWSDTFNTTNYTDGNYTFKIWANDTYNRNITSTAFNFTIDNTNPIITWTTPANDNSSYFSKKFTLNIKIVDTNLFNTSVRITYSNGSQAYYNNTLPSGLTTQYYNDVIDLVADNYTMETSATDDGSSPKIKDEKIKTDKNEINVSSAIKNISENISKNGKLRLQDKNNEDILQIMVNESTLTNVYLIDENEHYKIKWYVDFLSLFPDCGICTPEPRGVDILLYSEYGFTKNAQGNKLIYGNYYLNFQDLTDNGIVYVLNILNSTTAMVAIDPYSLPVDGEGIAEIDPVIGRLNNVTQYRNFTVDKTSPTIAFTYPTIPNASSIISNWTYINTTVSDNTNGNMTALLDFNNSLVGWWRFNNESGDNATSVKDRSVYGNNGTMTNMNVGLDNDSSGYTSSGKFGYGMNFDGTNDQIVFSNAQQFLMKPSQSFIISIWFKSIGAGGRLVSRQGGAWYILTVSQTTGKLSFVLNDGTLDRTISTTNMVNDSNWHYGVGVWDASLNKSLLYLDGVNVVNSTMVNFTTNNFGITEVLRIGSYIGVGQWFNGTIDEVRIYNRVLSGEEINASYNAGLYRLYNNFTGLLSNTTYNFTAYVQDAAGNVGQTETRFTQNTTCNCPSVKSNWAINMEENCNIISTCNNTGYNLEFYNKGYTKINTTIWAYNISKIWNNSILYLNSNATVYLGET